MKKISLPVDQYIHQIEELVKKESSVIISAPPGSGKTTRIAPALMHLCEKKIVMLQPRRIAAISSAQRIADENSWTLGNEVGYQVRYDNKTSVKTKINIITEALLIKKMTSDPDLLDTDMIIIDEFHERSLSTDLAIACVKELQELSRPDLKLIVMSATIDKLKLSEYLGNAPVVDIITPTYPVEIIFSKKPITYKITPEFYLRIKDTLLQALKMCEGNILIFLPGMREIKNAMQICQQNIKSSEVDFFSLHGSMNLEDQKLAIMPSAKRKVILTTNIAETSLTVDGVDGVIDSGLVRKSSYDMKSQGQKISLGKISKASAQQRAGRSHRQKKGFTFKLWTELDEASMNDFNAPDIMTSDLSEAILFLTALGITDVEKFSWFEMPDQKRLLDSYENLKKMNCIQKSLVTEKGKKILNLPMDVSLSSLFYDFVFYGEAELGARVVSFLNEPGSFEAQSVDDFIIENPPLERWNWSTRKNHEQLLQIAKSIKFSDKDNLLIRNLSSIEKAQIIILTSFYFNLGKIRDSQQKNALLFNGKGASLKHLSKLEEEYFVATSFTQVENQNELKVNYPIFVPKKWIELYLKSKIQKTIQIEFEEDKNKFYKYEEVSIGEIVLHLGQKQIAEDSDVKSHLPQILWAQWKKIITQNENLQNWVNRILYYKKIQNPDAELYTEEQIQSAIEMASAGESDFNTVMSKDWIYFLELQLSLEINSLIHSQYPLKIKLNSPKVYTVQYSEDLPPIISAKIQEFYGFKEHIYVGNKIPVTLELLAPNYRPTQITNDIVSFWKTSYPQIKKELKGRYPRHDWPEDPENYEKF